MAFRGINLKTLLPIPFKLSRGWKQGEPAGKMPALHRPPARAGGELPEANLSVTTALTWMIQP